MENNLSSFNSNKVLAENISVAEALRMTLDAVVMPHPLSIPVADATGCVLAQDIYSPIAFPPFDQVAMDGYALNWQQTDFSKPAKVSRTLSAGEILSEAIPTGQVVRVFTGTALPVGADTVVRQEWVKIQDGCVEFIQPNILKGSDIRFKGEVLDANSIALKKGDVLTPGGVGFLAGLGIAEVSVFLSPAISILITGDEMLFPGEAYQHGKVYESNSIALRAALLDGGIEPNSIVFVPDDPKKIQTALEQALSISQIVLIVGGCSLGGKDFTASVLSSAGVNIRFHRVNQRPGKPMMMGVYKDKIIFGLPGNPSTALMVFYRYVVPVIRKMLGLKNSDLPQPYKLLGESIQPDPVFTLFVRARLNELDVFPLPNQESYRLDAFAKANALIVVPPGESLIEQGSRIQVIELNAVWK